MSADTQALRDALDAVKKSEAGGQYTIAAHKAYAFLTAHGDALLARLTSDGDAMRGAMVEADFERGTITFAMNGDYYASAGEYFIWPAAPAQPSEGDPR